MTAQVLPPTASPQPPTGEKALAFPLNDTLPALGQALQVAPGIFWIRMVLPFALDHINLWLLEDSEETEQGTRHGWTAVDCGVTNPGTQEAWRQVFEGPMKGLPILKVVVTHMHPDHMGLAHWLCEQFNAPLYMNATEYQAALLASTGASNFGGVSTQKFFADHGWNDPADQKQIQSRVSYYANMVPKVPESYHRLMEGSQIQIGQQHLGMHQRLGAFARAHGALLAQCQCAHQWRHGLAQNFYQCERLCPRARGQCLGAVHALIEKI